MEKIPLEEIRIETIKGSHLLESFRTANIDLGCFLKEDALYHQQQNISVTFLWFYKGDIVSYMSLLTDRVTLQGNLTSFFRDKGIYYSTLPALKIGRLCVDDRYQRRGLGKLMLEDATHIAKMLGNNFAGCRFLTVNAKEDAVPFYLKFGFKPLKNENNQTVSMFLDLYPSQHD